MLSRASSLCRRFLPNLVVLGFLAVSATAMASNDAVLDEIYREQNIQRQLPVVVQEDDPPSRHLGIPPGFGWFILAGAALGAAALAMWLMVFNLQTVAAKRHQGRTGRKPDDASPGPGTELPVDWLEKADNLARHGRFSEAIHLLLLGALAIVRVADGPASESKTAREIARTHVGPHPERLHALVRASELAHFGGRPATQAQFETCRRDAVAFDQSASPAPA